LPLRLIERHARLIDQTVELGIVVVGVVPWHARLPCQVKEHVVSRPRIEGIGIIGAMTWNRVPIAIRRLPPHIEVKANSCSLALYKLRQFDTKRCRLADMQLNRTRSDT